ncbi:GNAT family N-acetyltransferase [Bifidobacterium choloepi]|uniref:GNAT family N-acetyltransferase n=1 Tax=Bifidobacterium choloepi TaxID=2614131 RepID=A0A6I5N1P9_9BIFI|nr:GNAT family N-acetyltransferase [Bifidobacterium choloepi]NEG70406.1 GNAT family N-acetyltransferase [Bifidobacterium choloepi]
MGAWDVTNGWDDGSVMYRPVEWGDVDAVADAFEATWPQRPPLGGTPTGLLVSRYFTLHYFALTTEGRVGLVAGDGVDETVAGTLDDEDFAGVTLVRRVGQPQLFPQAVAEMEDLKKLIGANPAGAAALARMEHFFAIEGMLEADSDVDLTSDTELELFLVGPAARGRGVGGALWRQFLADLTDAGVRNFFLHTDSGCDYAFYERHGLTRVAERLHADHPEDLEFLGVTGPVDEGPQEVPLADDQFIYRGDVARVAGGAGA